MRSAPAAGSMRRIADHHRIGAQRKALGGINAGADSARCHQLHLACHARIIERLAGSPDGAHGGNACVVEQKLGAGAGSAFRAVHDHHIGACFGSHSHIKARTGRAHLDEDRHLIIGRDAQLFDFDRQIIGPQKVRVANGRALIDALGTRLWQRH